MRMKLFGLAVVGCLALVGCDQSSKSSSGDESAETDNKKDKGNKKDKKASKNKSAKPSVSAVGSAGKPFQAKEMKETATVSDDVLPEPMLSKGRGLTDAGEEKTSDSQAFNAFALAAKGEDTGVADTEDAADLALVTMDAFNNAGGKLKGSAFPTGGGQGSGGGNKTQPETRPANQPEGQPAKQPAPPPEAKPAPQPEPEPEPKPSGFVAFKKIKVKASGDVISIAAGSAEAIGAGTYAARVVALHDGKFVGASSPKQFEVTGQRGTTPGLRFDLDPGSGGLEKLKGGVSFVLLGQKVVGQELHTLNSLPAAVANMRYGKVVDGGPTYAAALSGRAFRAQTRARTGQPLVSIAAFQFDSRSKCLALEYLDAIITSGRADEGVGYQGCAELGGGQVVFKVNRICKYALNNEPQCKEHSEAVKLRFQVLQYGVRIGHRIFREPTPESLF